MERNKNLSLEELKQQIEFMKRKVAEKERKLKKLEKAAESRRQKKVTEEKNNQVILQKDGSLKECGEKNMTADKICDNCYSLETITRTSEYKNKILSLKETEKIDNNNDILLSTDTCNLYNNVMKSNEFIMENSKVCAKFEDDNKSNNSLQKIQVIENTLSSSSKNITEKKITKISTRDCSLLRRSARLTKQKKYSDNEHLGLVKEHGNRKIKMEQRLKIKSVFSYLIDKVKQMDINDFILSNEICGLENKYITKKTNFENLLKSEFTEQNTEKHKIVCENRLNNINNLQTSKCENKQIKDKENVSNNLLHCLKTDNKEGVRKIYQCVIPESGNELIVIQQRTTCSFWIKDSSRWKLNYTYITENAIPINDCCLLCKNTIYFVESELQIDKFMLNLFHYDWKIGKLNKIYSYPNLNNGNSCQTLILCKTEELTCAIMLSTDIESIIFILNLKEERGILQSSLHFLDKVKCNITSLLSIEKLSQALLGCGRNHIYIWNYIKGRLIWESRTNKDIEVDNCFWVRAEMGLLFLIISTDDKTKLSLIVLNPNTSDQAILRTYQYKQEILVSAQGNYLAVFDMDIISVYNIFSANKVAFANIKEVTVIVMMTDLLLGFKNGCSHFYQITKL